MPKSDVQLCPYVPFATFENQIVKLGEKGQLPSRIDNSVLSNLAGGTQSQLLSAWRFFGLIDGEGKPSPDLQKLAKSPAESWSEILAKLIRAHYSEKQLEQLETGSPSAFAEAFPGSGSVRQKACRFLIVAARRAGMRVSPHLATESGRLQGFDLPKSGKKRIKKPGAASDTNQPEPTVPEAPHAPPAGMKTYRFALPGARAAMLSWPADITQVEIKSLWAQLGPLQAMLEAEAKFRNMRSDEEEEE